MHLQQWLGLFQRKKLGKSWASTVREAVATAVGDSALRGEALEHGQHTILKAECLVDAAGATGILQRVVEGAVEISARDVSY